MRRSRANIAKGESRDNGACANWHGPSRSICAPKGRQYSYLYQRFQCFDVLEQDFPTLDFNESFGSKIFEHAGDHLAG